MLLGRCLFRHCDADLLDSLHSMGVQISNGYVFNLLIKCQGDFHDEKGALFEAGLAKSPPGST